MVKFIEKTDKLAMISFVVALVAFFWRVSPLSRGCGQIPNIFSLIAILIGISALINICKTKLKGEFISVLAIMIGLLGFMIIPMC